MEIAYLDMKLSFEHVKSEKELLTTHTEWLNSELTRKSAELLRIQSERNTQISTLEVSIQESLSNNN